jgi:hypothetical protein
LGKVLSYFFYHTREVESGVMGREREREREMSEERLWGGCKEVKDLII